MFLLPKKKAHLIACVWFAISYGDPNGWITGDEPMASQLAENPDDLTYAWLSSFYWVGVCVCSFGVPYVCVGWRVLRWYIMSGADPE